MNNENIPTSRLAQAEDIVFEADLIPTYGDMEMMLSQEGVTLTRHAKNYLSEIASLPALDAEGIARLAADPTAKADLIEGCMRLVVCAAKSYDGRGVMFMDLLQEGALGLVGAAETYGGEGDFRIHAVLCILDALESAVEDAEAMDKIPDHVTELLNRISRSDMELEVKLGREATPEEISADTGIELDEVTAVMEMMEDAAALNNAESGEGETEDHEQDGDCDCGHDHSGEHPHPHYDPGRHKHS